MTPKQKEIENKGNKYLKLGILFLVLLIGLASTIYYVEKDKVPYVVTDARVWDGGGGDNLWNTAANWSGDLVPTDTDAVTIDTAVTVTATGTDISFATLTIGGTNAAILILQNNIT